MKKYWPYILGAVVIITIFVIRDMNNSKKVEALENMLKISEEKVIAEKTKLQEATKRMVNDSIRYEKDKQHIKELRSRYPDDALLDSLVRAGQSINK